MRERVEALVGRGRARDVGDDLPLAVRAHPAPRGRAARLHARASRSTTTTTRSGSCERCLEELELDTKRFPPRRGRARRSPTPRTSCVDAEPPTASRSAAAASRTRRRRRLRALRARAHGDERDGLRRPADAHGQPAASCSPRCAQPLPAQRFRYVLVDEYQDTNHAQYRLAQPARRRARQPLRGRRRRPVDLRAGAAPTSATSSSSSTTSPTPKVIRLEQNYRSTETILDAANAVDRPQPPSARARTSGRARRRATTDRRSSSSTTSTPRRGSSPARSRSCSSAEAGDRRRAHLPRRTEIAVFYRTNAQSRVLEDSSGATRSPTR